MATNTALKPLKDCPFCGAAPETGITGAPECENWRYVHCSSDHCSARHSLFNVESWNARVDHAPNSEAAALLGRMCVAALQDDFKTVHDIAMETQIAFNNNGPYAVLANEEVK